MRSALKDTMRERMNGTKLTSTTRSPKSVVTVSGTTSVRTPLLVCAVCVVAIVVVVVVVALPDLLLLTDSAVEPGTTPDQFVCHSFHTVPVTPAESAKSLNASYTPSWSMITCGRVSVSFQLSDSGDSFKSPFHVNILYGFTNSA